jgi:chromosome segregation ATPase
VPDELDEIRQRLDRVETRLDSEIGQRLDSVESRLNTEASLRAMMDLDQATLTTRLDAQDTLLRALAVTQSEHTERFRRLEEGHRRLEEGHRRLEEGHRRLEEGHGRVEAGVSRVETGIRAILGLLGEDR